MLLRKSILAATIAAAVAVSATGTVLADHEEEQRVLHAARGPVIVERSDRIMLDRARTMRRLDRALAEADELAKLVREVQPHPVWGRLAAPSEGRERPGARVTEERAPLHGIQRPQRIDRDEILRRTEALNRELVALRRRVERAPAAPVVRVIEPIADHALHGFLGSVQRARFSSDKLARVRGLVGRSHMTAAQAALIMRVLPSWIQVDAGVLLYGAVLDAERFDLVFAELRYRGDRYALRGRLARIRR